MFTGICSTVGQMLYNFSKFLLSLKMEGNWLVREADRPNTKVAKLGLTSETITVFSMFVRKYEMSK
jgi:hypothetical protein